MKKLVYLSLLLIVSCSLFNENAKPIEFMNMKNANNILESDYNKKMALVYEGEKDFFEYFEICSSNITKKSGLVFGADFGKSIDALNVKLQILDDLSSGVVFQHEYDVSPDMTSLQAFLNLNYFKIKKGKYRMNLIAKEKIIAQGVFIYE